MGSVKYKCYITLALLFLKPSVAPKEDYSLSKIKKLSCHHQHHPGGGTLIFSHIRRLGPFFWVPNFEYFFGV